MSNNMDNYVPVLTRDGRPLGPCHPKRARSLVKQGKASFRHRRGIRCIILHKTNIPKVKNASKLQLRIDPGAEKTGIAVTRDHSDDSRSALLVLELQHRGRAIKNAMVKRKQHRSKRRYRKTRYRQPRFNNRTRPSDWLPPSLLSRLQNTLTWARRLSRLLPITEVHIETSVFDPQLLRNPEIKGVEYQQGPLYRTNLRAAVLHRDGNKCCYCGKSGKRNKLELDHVVPRSKGGPNRYDNLVAACHACNQKRGNQPLEVWLKRRPKKLAEIQARLGMELASASHMNVILPRLLTELHHDGWTVVQHSAATTAAGRRICAIEKSHHADAALTGCPTSLAYIPTQPIVIEAKGRGQHQRIMPDKHGTPRGRRFREYCKLPRRLRHRTLTPGHKKRAKRVGGIATGDYVRFIHLSESIRCYGVISNDKVAEIKPRWIGVKAELTTAIERGHGYHIYYT